MTFFKKTSFRLIVIGLLVSLPLTGFLACTGPSRIESPGEAGEDKPKGDGPDEEATPPISIPAPPLPLIKNEKILIATMDSESRNPVIAFPGAIDVSEMNDVEGDGYVNDIRMAVAPETSEEIVETRDLASLHSCPIKTDGSAECYPVGDNGTTYCVYLTDGTNKLTTPFCEDPNVNVVWNGKPVKDIVKAPDHPYLGSTYHVLTDTHISTISKSDDPEDPAMIWGDFADNYKHATVKKDTKNIAYDPETSILANRVAVEGIPLSISEYEAGSLADTLLEGLDVLITDTGDVSTVPETMRYTKLKLSGDNKLRFGRKANSATFVEYIYDVSFDDPIQFIGTGDTGFINIGDDRVDTLTHRRTIAFDVDGSYAIVVFEDAYGKSRLRMSNGVAVRFGGRTPLAGTAEDYDFKDLQIYHTNSSNEDYGKALLLDAKNNRIGLVKFNWRTMGPNPREINITNWINLGEGKNPQAFALKDDKTKAYIVNQGDETVSVLDLTPAVPTIEAEINIPDIIPGKDLTIKPNEITISGDNLLVGTEDLRSAMVVPVSMAEPITTSRMFP